MYRAVALLSLAAVCRSTDPSTVRYECETTNCQLHDEWYEATEDNQSDRCADAQAGAVAGFITEGPRTCRDFRAAPGGRPWNRNECRRAYCQMYEDVLGNITNTSLEMAEPGYEGMGDFGFYGGDTCRPLLAFNRTLCESSYRDAEAFCDCICPTIDLLEQPEVCDAQIFAFLLLGRRGGQLHNNYPLTEYCANLLCKFFEAVGDPSPVDPIPGIPGACKRLDLPYRVTNCRALVRTDPYDPEPWKSPNMDNIDILTCTDGSEHVIYHDHVDTFEACYDHGDRWLCPANQPVMCNTRSCVAGTDFCCVGPPTAAPTRAPTAAPTHAPTVVPSSEPTAAPPPDPPTAFPTRAPPTAAPTRAPTAAPTHAPTAAPTDAPTAAPTEAPTAAPPPTPPMYFTPEPTDAPTPAPTPPLTRAPTAAPTPEPTPAPSAAPTTAPTAGPTVAPDLLAAESCPTGEERKCSPLLCLELPEWYGFLSPADYHLAFSEPTPAPAPQTNVGSDTITTRWYATVSIIVLVSGIGGAFSVVTCVMIARGHFKTVTRTLVGGARLNAIIKQDPVHKFEPTFTHKWKPHLPLKPLRPKEVVEGELLDAAAKAALEAAMKAVEEGSMRRVASAEGSVGQSDIEVELEDALNMVKERGLHLGALSDLAQRAEGFLAAREAERRLSRAEDVARTEILNIGYLPATNKLDEGASSRHWDVVERLRAQLEEAQEAKASDAQRMKSAKVLEELVAKAPQLPVDKCVLDPRGEGIKLLPPDQTATFDRYTGEQAIQVKKETVGSVAEAEGSRHISQMLDRLGDVNVDEARPVCAQFAKKGHCKVGRRCPWRHCVPKVGDTVRDSIVWGDD